MLAESAATDLSKAQTPQGYGQSVKIAKKGGSVAKAADYLPPVQDSELLEGGEDNEDR